jgi:cell division protein FtsW
MQPARQAHAPDYPLILAVVALVGLGLIMVFSTTYMLRPNDPAYFILRQLGATALGVVLLLFLMRSDYRRWQRVSVWVMGIAVVLLIIVLFKGGGAEARRWLFSTSVQPAEIVKLALVLYIADWLSHKGAELKDLVYGLLPFGLLVGAVAALLILEPDFGTAILLILTAVSIFFIAGADILQLAMGSVLGGGAILLVAIAEPYRMNRFKDFLNPFKNMNGIGWQISQALIALASGGFFGKGLGSSLQKQEWLPLAYSDTIFAVIGEELGLLGCLLVIGLFALLAYRGFRIALQAPDRFGSLLATGVTCWLVLQAMVNIGGITASLPFTGVPLPFISYGGSSMVTCLAGVGLLLSVSRQTQRLGGLNRAALDLGGWDGGPRLPRSRRR